MQIPAKILMLVTALWLSCGALAAITETNLPLANAALPSVKITNENGTITWGAYKSSKLGSVGLHGLTEADALHLLDIAKKAKAYATQIASQGGCPNGFIQSGELGRLTDHNAQQKYDDDKMIFQVVCEDNKILLEIYLSDEDIINHVSTQVNWQDLENLARAILSKYNQKEI